MLRRASSRNQRSRGSFKLKNAVQACVLVVICFWLLYQMKHSRERKSYEGRDSSGSEESEVESARYGRKVLPGLIESEPVRERQTEGKYEENVKIIREEIKHEENEDRKGGISYREMDAQNQEKVSLEESITHTENKSGKDVTSVILEDQEHDKKSHEAREKSFRGDDASSEVFHNTQEPEHDEPSHEAQERRFNGDDASSAVEHITENKESESAEDVSLKNDDTSVLEHFTKEKESENENGGARNLDENSIENLARINRESDDARSVDSTADSSVVELLDTFEGSSSSPSKGEDDSPSITTGTVNVTAHGAKKEELVPTVLEERSPSGAINKESDITKTTEAKTIVTKQNNLTSVGNQTDIATDSTDKSKDQFKLQTNSSALSQEQVYTETSVNLTPGATYLQGQLATSHTTQALNDSIIIQIPGENFSLQNNVSEASNVPNNSDTSPSPDQMVKSSNTFSATDEDGKRIPQETNTSSLTIDQKEAQGENYPSNLQNIRNMVNDTKLEAAD